MDAAAIVIGLISLGVAIMAMINPFGKPRFKVLYGKKLGYALTCWIKSIPPSKFLLSIGVDRRFMDIDCEITIWDMRENIVENFWYPTMSSNNLHIPVAGIKCRNDGRVFLNNPNNAHGGMLDVGLYIFELEIWDAKYNVLKRKERKYFRVNSTNPFVEWVGKGKMPKRKVTKRKITIGQFHNLIKKAAQPIKPTESDSKQSQTSGLRQGDDYNETDTHSGMTEDTSD